jgi:uncharacterized protein YbcC (UPF0753/DUF2309 family)
MPLMPEVMEITDVEIAEESLSPVERVSGKIPPLWDLNNYVAVNPFLGFASQSIVDSVIEIAHGLGAAVLPPIEFYCRQWKQGTIHRTDLNQAAKESGLTGNTLEEILAGSLPVPHRQSREVMTMTERYDLDHGTDWDGAIMRSTTRWCAVYASSGASHWTLPTASQGLYASWRSAACADRSMEILGLTGWRKWIGRLPETASEAAGQVLAGLDIPATDVERYLYRLLRGVYGWASYFRRSSWIAPGARPDLVAELLAIRLCADSALAALAKRSRADFVAASVTREDEAVRLALQTAFEDGYARKLTAQILPSPVSSPAARLALQAVFCIDVRSEPLRRHLEAQSQSIVTKGFAGFFGIALDWQADGLQNARCPVLLQPAVKLRPHRSPSALDSSTRFKHLQSSPAVAFSFVETLGLLYGISMARDALAATSQPSASDRTDSFSLESGSEGLGIAPASRIDLAAGILTNMGLRSRFARLVLLCGHGGKSTNNPHAAGLDCGACGGHTGSINARVAAAILNDPAVRAGLQSRGIDVPDDTWFLPGLHDTSVDRVELLDLERVPPGHLSELAQLRTWLDAAGAQTRAERSKALGLAGLGADQLQRSLRRRANDWSEVRPEWGLARNAAFIAARRERTRGVDLGGRVFLHDYDAAADTNNAVLTLILTGPMVVASWINLQYFASTVDNDFFGCGDKAIHNRVGSHGVVLGNGGDLRTGLPLQSVHAADGSWFHEPIRLQVFVEADTDRIDQVLAAQPGVRDLVDNGWVRLFALSQNSNQVSRRLPRRCWEFF